MGRPRLLSDDEILDGARECFMEGGLSVSTQIIAERLGISQPAIFKRFGTKEELVLASLAPPERIPVLDWIDGLCVSNDLEGQLSEVLGKIWESLQWIIPRMMVLQTSGIAPSTFLARYKTPPLINVLESIAGYFRRAQENGALRADGDARTWAMSLLGAVQGRAMVRYVVQSNYGAENDADYLSGVAALLLRGMVPDGGE